MAPVMRFGARSLAPERPLADTYEATTSFDLRGQTERSKQGKKEKKKPVLTFVLMS